MAPVGTGRSSVGVVLGLLLLHFDSAVLLCGNREAVASSQGKATWLSHVLGRNKEEL